MRNEHVPPLPGQRPPPPSGPGGVDAVERRQVVSLVVLHALVSRGFVCGNEDEINRLMTRVEEITEAAVARPFRSPHETR